MMGRPVERKKMSDKDRGVYRKYHVERLNDDEGKHDNCFFFVLDPRHDPIAAVALRTYARVAKSHGYDTLAADLFSKVTSPPHSQDSLRADLERWFHRLGSDDPKWWAKEIHAYLVNGDPLVSDGGSGTDV